MNLEAYQNILDDVRLDSDRAYLSLQLPIDGYDIDEQKIFSYFRQSQGARYWFRSKDDRYNTVGIEYLESIKRDKYSSRALAVQKSTLYDKVRKWRLKRI